MRDAVDLMANEVRNAVDWIPTDLFVVDRIDVTEVDGNIRTRGGRARRWADWTPPATRSAYEVQLPLGARSRCTRRIHVARARGRTRLGGLTLVFTARRLHYHAMCCSLSEEGQGRTALRIVAIAQRVAEARDD